MKNASQPILTQAVSNLWSFLETWLDYSGGVHGYVVHHHHDNMKILSPDTWTQAPCILGALEIFKKTGDEKWLNTASFLGDFLVNTYIRELHVYRNSNHEHKPLGTPVLIHNALPSYSLLELTNERKSHGMSWQRYYEVAKDNIQNFILRYWDNSVGAISSRYHGRPAHIHNMNSAAIMAIVSLAKADGNFEYIQRYARRIGDYILSCQVKHGYLSGAYPYVDNDRNFRTLYSLITAFGLLALYDVSKEDRFLTSIMELVKNLSEFVDYNTGLICHFHKKGYPQWLPDTLLFLALCNKIVFPHNDKGTSIQDILSNVIRRQYPTGGFPLSIGFEDLWYTREIPSRPEIRRWRDILATPNWNAWNFWSLSMLIAPDAKLPFPKVSFPFEIHSDMEENEGPYKIVETDNKAIFYLLDKELITGLFLKKKEIADFCVIMERGNYWGTLREFLRYPEFLRNFILALPKLIHK